MKRIITAILGGKNAKKSTHRYTAYAIVYTLLVFALAAMILVVSSIAFSISDAKNPEPHTNQEEGEGNGSSANAAVLGLTTGTYAEGQLYSGELIILNSNTPFNSASTNKNDLVNLSSSRVQKPNVTEGFKYYYTVFGDTAQSATTATQKALDDMLTDYYTANNNDDNLIVSKACGAGGIYESGLVVALRYYDGELKKDITKETHVWLYTNAYKYGFIALTSEGENVFRYVGAPHSTYMKEKNITTVEKYVDLLKSKGSSPLNIGDKVYALYISSGATPMISGKYAYTVSGNNVDGYIVTVNTKDLLTKN